MCCKTILVYSWETHKIILSFSDNHETKRRKIIQTISSVPGQIMCVHVRCCILDFYLINSRNHAGKCRLFWVFWEIFLNVIDPDNIGNEYLCGEWTMSVGAGISWNWVSCGYGWMVAWAMMIITLWFTEVIISSAYNSPSSDLELCKPQFPATINQRKLLQQRQFF